jgi:hypothetical protein
MGISPVCPLQRSAFRSAAKGVQSKEFFALKRAMNYSDELLAVAKRIFWFGTPEEALEFPKRFLTYAMTYASEEDVEILRKYFSNDDFKATLDDPASGIFDQSSWAKWNERYNRTPVPPLPRRQIPGVDPATIPDFFSPKVLKPTA